MRIAALALVALASAALVVAAGKPAAAASCGSRLPTGAGGRAAEAVIDACARTAYRTQRPDDVEGWLQVAPKIRNARGLWEYAAFVWLDAPDAPPAAFEVFVELREGRWTLSSVRHAPGSAEPIVAANFPT